MDVGSRIIRLRERKNWNQRELAKRIGLNVSVMNRIESGDRPIKDHELSIIADVLETSADYLLGREDAPNDLEYYKNKIVSEFPDIDLMFKDMESLSADDMKEVYEYIKFKMSQKKEER